MKKVLLSLSFLFSTAFGVEYSPWLSPLWEIQTRFGYFYRSEHDLKSDSKTFSFEDRIHTASMSIGGTIWPDLSVETELLLSKAKDICFTYESFFLTGRKLLYDDRSGLDPLSLMVGATFFFPAHRFLHSFSFPYHGHVNLELHGAIGKEWDRGHVWGLAGFGFAERGYPWFHGILSGDYALHPCHEVGVFGDCLMALAGHPLDIRTFNGYAHVAHRSLDIGAFWVWHLGLLGSLNLFIWDRVYSQNFVKNEWGIGANFYFPFGL